MKLPTGVSSHTIQTDRLRMRFLESGRPDGIPVVMIHGNLATGRFFEHLMPGAPEQYRIIAPDMRGFGDTEPVPIDATRGLRDWADDSFGLVKALGITRPVHLVGWSTGAPRSRTMPRTGRWLRSHSSIRSRLMASAESGLAGPHVFRITQDRAEAPETPSSQNGWPATTRHPTHRSHPETSSTPHIGHRRIESLPNVRTCSSTR